MHEVTKWKQNTHVNGLHGDEVLVASHRGAIEGTLEHGIEGRVAARFAMEQVITAWSRADVPFIPAGSWGRQGHTASTKGQNEKKKTTAKSTQTSDNAHDALEDTRLIILRLEVREHGVGKGLLVNVKVRVETVQHELVTLANNAIEALEALEPFLK